MMALVTSITAPSRRFAFMPHPPTAPQSANALAPEPAPLTSAAATLVRPRLLAQCLSQAAPAVWLQGPGGCGKSVTLQQWAHAQGRGLQVLDARQTTDEQLLTALQCTGLGLTPGQSTPLICLDHVHAATDPGLMAALDQLAERWAEPVGMATNGPMPLLALCSHQPPPPAWAEAQLHGQLRVVPHHELAFTSEEALRLAEQWGVPSTHAHALQALTGGWASGMALGLRYVADFPPVGEGLDEVSARLSMIVERKLLAGLPVRTRALLGMLSEFDRIPAAALDELGFDGQALKRFLHECARDGVLAQWAAPGFVLRPLLASAARTQPHAALHDAGTGWQDEIDQALLRSGHWPQALAWRLNHAQPERAAELLQTHAQALLTHQQGATLLSLAESIPPRAIDHHPALRLALIQARMRFDEAQAQADAAQAWALWHEQGQHAHALRAAALALWSLRLDMGDVRACLPALDRWERSWAQAGLDAQPPALWPLPELVGRVAHALFDQALLAGAQAWIAALTRQVDDGLAQRANAPSGDDLLAAAFVLTESLYACGHAVEVQSLVDQVMRSPLVQGHEPRPLATPLLRARWHLLVFDWEMESGLSRYAATACETAWQLSAAHGLGATALLSGLGLARLALDRGEADQAQSHLQDCEPFAHAAGSINHLLYLSAHTRAALAAQQFSAAVHAARRALDYAERSDVPRDNHGRWVVDLHHALAAQGQFQASAQVLRDYSPHAQAGDHDFYEALACLALALHWRKADAAHHETQLRRGMALAAQEQYIWFFRPLPALAATLCADALRLNVVPDFVRSAIDARKLPPSDEASIDWPWPLRIHTLSGVRLVRHGQPMVFSGKVPQRPLDLLCFVACAGPQGADRGTLARQLWDDGEGDIDLDAATKAMDVALVRLRKLLGDGSEAWLLSHNGRIALNPQAVWVDVQQLRQFEAQAQQAQLHQWPALALRVTQDLQALGPGDFLGSEERAPWVLAMRQQCRQMFVRAMQATSSVLLDGGQGSAAIQGLESALKLDPIAEPLYQALIRIHLACGQPNDALRVYRRCRDMLSVLTGSAPSAQTTQLKASIDQALPTGQ